MRNNKLMALIYATGLLLAFACNKSGLGVREAQSDGKLSETFQDYQYWSSHENSSGNTAVVNFGTYGNGKAQKPKFYPCHARCVRNIE